MFRTRTTPIIVAAIMIVLAVLARQGLADRDAVETMLLVLPIIYATSWLRSGKACFVGKTAA